MDIEKVQYFSEVKSALQIIEDNEGIKSLKLSDPIPLLPLQYKYIHNLQTGLFEEVEGIDTILGYENSQFNLNFYYGILHPDDLEIVFAMTHKALKWADTRGYNKPGDLQLTILQRVKRINGGYAFILRQTIVYETKGKSIVRTFSICTDVTDLGMISVKPAYLYIPDGLPFNHSEVFNQKGNRFSQMLSYREKDILFWAIEGYTSEAIGTKLGISKHTVDTHRRKILKKTGVSSILELKDVMQNSSLS